MNVYDLFIVKSGNCYVARVDKNEIHFCNELAGAKVLVSEIKALAYMKKVKDLDFKIVRLVEEAEIKCW